MGAHSWKILTYDNLKSRGFQGPSQCPLYKQDEEIAKHLLLDCLFVVQVWNKAFESLNLDLVLPNSLREVFVTWHKNYSIFKLLLKQVWKTLPCFISWKIWLSINKKNKEKKKKIDQVVGSAWEVMQEIIKNKG